MRELLREVVRKSSCPQCAEDADYLVLAQSSAYQTAMYEYFEGVLKTTLAENVRLLHGILPETRSPRELKTNGYVEPVYFKDAAVIFTDFEGFSQFTEHLAPAEVIRRLDTYFTEFDRISRQARPGENQDHRRFLHGRRRRAGTARRPRPRRLRRGAGNSSRRPTASPQMVGPDGWNIRIGIHAGPLVAGVIGKQKFSYDVWGATVNFASRMESSGAPGRINVSAEIHREVEPYYRLGNARPAAGQEPRHGRDVFPARQENVTGYPAIFLTCRRCPPRGNSAPCMM